MRYRTLLFIALIGFGPTMSQAQCLTANTGAGCASARVIVTPPSRQETLGPSPVEVGTVLERGVHNIVMNAPYYGLPRARDGWVYFRIENDVFRVDYNSMRVLERATGETSANWPP